jgi:hypothetical protein
LNKLITALVFLVSSSQALADRVQSPLYVGPGNNAQISASGGNLQLSNNGGTNVLSIPTITDTLVTLTFTQTLTNKTMSGGTITGTFSGTPTFSGAVTLNATGGNTPHACTIRSGTSPVSCSAGEIVLGGGCNTSTSIQASYPSSSTAWTCAANSGVVTNSYAVCCSY